jgi:hypothetical protein
VADAVDDAPPVDLAMRERDLEIALRRLVEAEERFVRESGVPLKDDISIAVAHARRVLGMKPLTPSRES